VRPTPQQQRLTQVALDELSVARPLDTLRIPFPTHPGLARVAAAILDKPADMNAIASWATVAAMSRRSFTRHFVAETGLTFAVWRHRVKTQAALRMLAAGELVTSVGLFGS
jgi:AraC-like DNA-binding protein